MKIYFAGSISGGRQDAGLYIEIITIFKKYGEVLTEHVGDLSLSKDELAWETKKAYIFERDVKWLESADFVVAEVTAVSLGVGYELGISEKLGKKVLCLFRPNSDKKLSAMIEGNKVFSIEYYQELSELEEIFNKYLV